MRPRVAKAFVATVAVAAMFGCASTSGGGGGGGGGGNMLTNEQLTETGETNAYQAVQRLRPQWLRPRGQGSIGGQTVVTLFVDGSPRGDASDLNTMQVFNIEDIRYLSASEAAFQFGTIAGNGGTLVVRTRR